MTKKLIILLLAIVLTLGLVACRRDKTQEYTLTFVDKDGTGVSTITVSGEAVVLPDAPEIPGYRFMGWYLNSVDSGVKLYTDYFVANPATSDMTAYAGYEKIEYTLTLIAGTEVQTQIKISDCEIELPNAPELSGYNFIGWCLGEENSNAKLDKDYFIINPATSDMTAFASYVEIDDGPDFIVTPSSLDGCAIEGIDGEMINVIIPETRTIRIGDVIKEYRVEAILDGAFAGRSEIESIFIPQTVTKIGNGAFSGCTNLKKITVPATVTADNVGTDIFANTPSLSEIIAPVWVVARADKSTLVKVELNAGISIGEGLFEKAENLVSVTLPETLQSIENRSFSGAVKLQSIHIPASVTEIADDAFTYCSSLERITVDANNKVYTSNNSNCIVKVEESEENGTVETLVVGCYKTVIYNGIENIGKYAFVGCTKLESLNIPSTVTNITEGAFYGCTSLKEITVAEDNAKYIVVDNCLIIPHSMRLVQGCMNSVVNEDITVLGETKKLGSISKHAFAGCINLKSIYIPSSIVKLEEGSFEGCKNLENVRIGNPELEFDNDVDVFSGCNAFKNIEVPMHWLSYFIDKARAVLETVSITTGTQLADGCFVGCSNLTYVRLPDELEQIGNGAFAGCEELTHVVITSSSKLSSIGHNAFDGCKKFKSINVLVDEVEENTNALVIPATVAYIGDYAFRNTAITDLQFAADGELSAVGYKVFAECGSLKNITIPSFVKAVDFHAFDACGAVEVATMPAAFIRSLANAKDKDGNSNVKTLTITEGSVDCYYIRDMKNLETLTIGKYVTDIDNKVFEGCSNLKNITVDAENAKYCSKNNCIIEKDTKTLILGCGNTDEIPEDVEIIKSYAFSHSAIKSVSIPAGVKVEAFAFSYCTQLDEIRVEGDGKVGEAVAIDPMAFDGCDKVTKAAVPANTIVSISKASLQEVEVTCGDIEAYAFKDCLELNKVIIAKDVTVGSNAFIGCDGITDIEAPATALVAFSDLKLTRLTINNLNADITSELIDNFKNVTYLKVVAATDEGKISDGAFKNFTSVTDADVPAWLLADMYTDKIVTLVINSGAAVGGNFRFPELETVTFGATVESVDASVFSQSSKLNAIIVDENNAKYTVVDNCLIDGTTVVLAANGATIPDGITEIGDYAFAGRNAVKNVVLPLSLSSIGNYAFAGCTSLVIDSFPEALLSVGNNAFANCTSLTSITLPGVKTIGSYAFSGCTSVTEIKLPVVESIGDGAFDGCNAVTNAEVPVLAINYMPKSLEKIVIVSGEKLEEKSFVGFEKLETLVIGATVESISPLMLDKNTLKSISVDEGNNNYLAENGFVITKDGKTLVFGCNVESVEIPEGVETIAENAFINCDAIKSVTIPSSVTSIHHFAFKGCTGIEILEVSEENATYRSEGNCILECATDKLIMGCKNSTIPEGVTEIGDYAFYGVTGLREIEIPVSVAVIGNYSFANTGIAEIRFANGVTSIGNNAFEACEQLNKVIFLENGQLKSVGARAFADCTKLNIIVVPTTLESVAADAFEGTSGVRVFWCGTAEEFAAISEELKSVLPDEVVYFSAANQPGSWYYKDGGISVDIWA